MLRFAVNSAVSGTIEGNKIAMKREYKPVQHMGYRAEGSSPSTGTIHTMEDASSSP